MQRGVHKLERFGCSKCREFDVGCPFGKAAVVVKRVLAIVQRPDCGLGASEIEMSTYIHTPKTKQPEQHTTFHATSRPSITTYRFWDWVSQV